MPTQIQTWGGVDRIESVLYRWPNGKPLPLGFAVAMRTLLYALGAAGVVFALTAIPGLGDVLELLKPVPRYILAVAAGVLAARTHVDGRTLHVVATDFAAYVGRSRLTSAGEPVRRGRVKGRQPSGVALGIPSAVRLTGRFHRRKRAA
jgi:hypothetical protein